MKKPDFKTKKRRLIQLLSALIYNANLGGFLTGGLFKGKSKGICVPGLNCYSCPGAVGACPLGVLQNAFGELRYKLPLYAVGFLLLTGVLLGRAVCGFLCPFGFLQELLYRIPTPKLKKNKITKKLSFLKYLILAVLVIGWPVATLFVTGTAVPGFCKFLCPAGTVEGGIPLVIANPLLRETIGFLFSWKVCIALLILLGCVFIFRAFCRFLCPLGAIYALFNPVAILGVRVDPKACTGCGKCVRFCKMDVSKINGSECIRCGECAAVCPENAVDPSFFPKIMKKNNPVNKKRKDDRS